MSVIKHLKETTTTLFNSSVEGDIEEGEGDELLEVWLCVFEFIYCCNMKKLFELLLLLMIEKKEADATEFQPQRIANRI